MSVVKFEYDAATAVNGYKTYSIKLSDYGIRAGMRVGIICIGGGGAGGGVKQRYSGGNVAKGGDAGKKGGGSGGGGAGYGYGAGGGGASGLTDYMNGFDSSVQTANVGEGGGGSGYLESDVITVTDAIAAATIVVSVGKGGTGGYTTGADGNPTSFGTYVTANGGVGGSVETVGYASITDYGRGGAGRAKGGNGIVGSSSGGGGAGGFIPGQPIAGNGENASSSSGAGRGGGITTGGGALPGQDGGDGNGVCFMIWED